MYLYMYGDTHECVHMHRDMKLHFTPVLTGIFPFP